jgi:hypothetical protein
MLEEAHVLVLVVKDGDEGRTDATSTISDIMDSYDSVSKRPKARFM